MDSQDMQSAQSQGQPNAPEQSVNKSARAELKYLYGFGNDLTSEAVPGSLPKGQNCVLEPAHGLYHEVINATSFTAPRARNLRMHLYRIRPSVTLPELAPYDAGPFLSAPLKAAPEPNCIRWTPFEMPDSKQDFLNGMTTLCANGSALEQTGMALHVYLANQSMGERVFANADGEMLIIPQEGQIRITTEIGIMEIGPSELAIIPRGCKMRIDLVDGASRGWVCENYGVPLQLPELGLIGSQGQANGWDFEIPVAAYEDRDVETLVVHKMGGHFYQAVMDHSPFDVVAWRGNFVPCKYNMEKFMVVGAVAFDHSDPSIYCALTSPSDAVAGANIDFMIMPPRWLVAERTFRPAAFHRNGVAEFLAVVWDRTQGGGTKLSGGESTLHNHWAPHGPDAALVDYGRKASQAPQRYERLFFMIESRYPFVLTEAGRNAPERDRAYLDLWLGFKNNFREKMSDAQG